MAQNMYRNMDNSQLITTPNTPRKIVSFVLFFVGYSCGISKGALLDGNTTMNFPTVTDVLGVLESNSSMIYACSEVDIALYQGTCNSLLYKPYRDGITGTCISQIPKMLNCTRGMIDICNRGFNNKTETDLKKQQYATMMSKPHMVKILCENAGLSRNITKSLADSCNSSFAAEYDKCFQPFFKTFDYNFGDPLLCEEYYASMECLSQRQQTHCNKDVAQVTMEMLRRLATRQGNPFCNINQGGADPEAIMKGIAIPSTSSEGGRSFPIELFTLLVITVSVAWRLHR